jgi:hypothetical protein
MERAGFPADVVQVPKAIVPPLVAIIIGDPERHLLARIGAKIDDVIGPRQVTPTVGGSIDIAISAVPDGGNDGIGQLDDLGQVRFPTI